MSMIEKVLASALIAAITAGCANTATCDPGQELRNGLCLSKASAGQSSADAGADASLACSADAASSGQFGSTCTDDSQCACPAPVCAVQPGQTMGFCTQVRCAEDPSICPPGWSCVDLTAIDPSYPPTCLQTG